MLRKWQLLPTLMTAIAVIVLTLSIAERAQAASKVTTSLRVPLNGSFYLDTNDPSTSEWIDFSGNVNLVAQVILPDPNIPPTPIRLHINMAGVTGIGRTSGQQFVLNGSENFEAGGAIPAS